MGISKRDKTRNLRQGVNNFCGGQDEGSKTEKVQACEKKMP